MAEDYFAEAERAGEYRAALATLREAVREWSDAKDATTNVAHQGSAGPERWAREARRDDAEARLHILATPRLGESSSTLGRSSSPHPTDNQ